MVKAALEYLIGLGKANVDMFNGICYSDKKLFEVPMPQVETIQTGTLQSVIDYIKQSMDRDVSLGRMVIQVVSEKEVAICSEADRNYKKRQRFLTALATPPEILFGHFYDVENFNILLQSAFDDSKDKELLLQVVGNLKDEAVRSIGDNGISQAVTVKTGVATVANVVVPNPVKLAPFCSFPEIAPVVQEFVFRMRTGGQCALFRADGGMWKVDMMKQIYEYLKKELQDGLEQGGIVLMM